MKIILFIWFIGSYFVFIASMLKNENSGKPLQNERFKNSNLEMLHRTSFYLRNTLIAIFNLKRFFVELILQVACSWYYKQNEKAIVILLYQLEVFN